MTIADLIDGLPIELLRGSPAAPITDVVEDSRRARPGCLFAARLGSRLDGRRFIGDAVDAGAAAVLGDREVAAAVPAGPAVLAAPDVAAVLAPLGERFFGRPALRLRLAGVTGTNGKTTITHLIQQVLGSSGVRCGLIGTVVVDDGAAARPSEWTTPPALEVSRLLRDMVRNGCAAAALEVSSHGLDQRRTDGLTFDVAVFSNLTGDHLDYHGTPEAYGAAKARLFESLGPDGTAVVNADDPAWERMVRDCPARVLRCSLREPGAECFARVGRSSIRGVEIELRGPWGARPILLPLVGAHNVANGLEAAAACFALGLDGAAIAAGLESCRAPAGRLERVSGPRDDVSVLVDYAHSDDALRRVLEALRGLVEPAGAGARGGGTGPRAGRGGRLRVVFGCGGDRDHTKRPRMGRVAARLADSIVVTSDNPRGEDPRAIIDQVLEGIPAGRRAETLAIVDRREAIARAIGDSRPGDLVLIAGKGHETYQIVGAERRPFDDRLVAAEALASRAGGFRSRWGAPTGVP